MCQIFYMRTLFSVFPCVGCLEAAVVVNRDRESEGGREVSGAVVTE